MHIVRENGGGKNARGAKACQGGFQAAADRTEEVYFHEAGVCGSQDAVKVDMRSTLDGRIYGFNVTP